MTGGYDEVFRANNLVACRWQHSQAELGNVVAPANILFLRLKPTRAWRVQGRKTESSAPQRNGLGLIAQGNDGSWRYRDDVDIVHIYITDAWLAEVSAAEGGPACANLRDNLNLDDPVLKALSGEVAGALNVERPSKLYAETLGLTISMRLLRAHSSASGATSLAHSRKGLSSRQLGRATAALSDQLGGDPSLSQLAATAGLSKYHFVRAFKASTGLPPHRYLVQLRMDRARILLETTNLPVTEIAARVGYDDPGYLSRLFRSQFGTTPAKYRRDLRF